MSDPRRHERLTRNRSSGRSSTEELLQDPEWVARLAISLVGDSADADDLAQEGWLDAFTYGGVITKPAAWFKVAIRNRWINRVRSDRRRTTRERSVARSEAVASEGVILERLEAAEIVSEAVRRLPPESRSVILHRYYLGLTVAETSEELGIPPATVRSRTSRALARLRAELESRHHDLRSLLLPLLIDPVSPLVAASGGPLVGGVIVQSQIQKIAAVVLAALLLWWVIDLTSEHSELDSSVARSSSSGIESGSGQVALEGPTTSPIPPSASPSGAAGSALPETLGADHPWTPESESEEASTDGNAWIEGEVHLLDESGERLEYSRLEFFLLQHGVGDSSPTPVDEVEIDSPRFRARVHPDRTLRFVQIQVDDEPGVPIEDRFVVPDSGPLIVETRLYPLHQISVFDVQSGRPLHDVVVVESLQYVAFEEIPVREICATGRSPVDFRSRHGLLYVGAPGYAWKGVSFDPLVARRYEVGLERGGSIEILLEGVPREAAWISVSPADAPADQPPKIFQFASTQPVVLHGIPAGAKRVWVNERAEWTPSSADAEATCTVELGRTVEVILERRPKPEPIAVRGRVFLLAEHALTGMRFRSASTGEVRVLDSIPPRRAGRFDWQIDLDPGTWRLELVPYPVGRTIEVEPDMPTIDLEIPSLVRTEVMPSPNDPAIRRIRIMRTGASDPFLARDFERTGDEPFVFDAPAGGYLVQVLGLRYRGRVEIRADRGQRIELPVTPRSEQGLLVRLVSRGRVLPVDGVELQVIAVGSPSSSADSRDIGLTIEPRLETGSTWRIPSPDTVELELRVNGAPPGYRAPSPTRVHVVEGRFEEVEIELMPR